MSTQLPTRQDIEQAEPLSFNRTAKPPQQAQTGPALQWATGLPTADRRIYAGWFIEAGKDDDLDRAAYDAGLERVQIKHGSGKVVQHYALEVADLFLLADSVQPLRSVVRDGIAVGWGAHPTSGKPLSHLRCKVMIRDLMAVGYVQPLTLAVKGTLTQDLIDAFTRQYAVLDAAFKAGKGALPLYAFSIPIGPGAAVFRGKEGSQKEITPPVAFVPEPVTADYMKQHWIGRSAWKDAIEQQMDAVLAWADAESNRIAQGEEFDRTKDII